MKKSVFILGFAIVFSIFSVSLIISDFTGGDKLAEIGLIYGPSQAVNGWVNISLDNEPSNSLLTALSSSIELKEFLDANNAVYSCSPLDCMPSYSSMGTGVSSKSFSLNWNETEIFGIKLTGDVTGINSLSFNVATDAGKSCLHPIQIDVLNDDIIEWKAQTVANDFTCVLSNNYGCWDETEYSGDLFLITDSRYCENINLVAPAKSFRIGAEIIEATGGDVDFKMEINTNLNAESCIVTGSASGTIGCNVEFPYPITDTTQAEVCISTDKSGDNGKYQIKYEEVSPCGFAGNQDYDFPIFVNPGKYDAVSDFTFDQTLVDGDSAIDLADEIWSYISSKYNGDCNPECIVPIKFESGISQTNTISSMSLIYQKGGSLSETNIYDINETPALISSDFQKLDLEKGNFLAPDDYGEVEFRLELKGSKIFEQDIEVKPVPEIKKVMPNIVPASVEVDFFIILEEPGANLTYSWDFGDGDTETSETNTITHIYTDIGTYDLIAKVSNNHGESLKTFQISVVSPKDAINDTLKEYEDNLEKIKDELDNIPLWIKTEIEKKVDLDNLNSSLNIQKGKYDDASSDQDYVEIMNSLLNLKIPYKFNVSQRVNPTNFFLSQEQLDLEVLDNLGAGSPDETEEKYYNAVNNWIQENLDISLESKTYSFYYKDSTVEPLVSYVKIILNPKNDLEEIYFIVNGDPEMIEFNNIETESIEGVSEAVIFSELSGQQIIEFLYPSEINIQSFPIFVSPELKDLDTGIVQKCEKDKGENSENCRTDCKPLGWTIVLLFGLFFVGFIVYIILQEWYKKHYESRLFKSKNQLYNLINFMSNSLTHGLKKAELFKKLKPLGWKGEQLNYAWKKLHGKRTGMWEIPLFKWVEKKQVKKELSKRTKKPNLKGLNLK
jgi:PKD repeat protein